MKHLLISVFIFTTHFLFAQDPVSKFFIDRTWENCEFKKIKKNGPHIFFAVSTDGTRLYRLSERYDHQDRLVYVKFERWWRGPDMINFEIFYSYDSSGRIAAIEWQRNWKKVWDYEKQKVEEYDWLKKGWVYRTTRNMGPAPTIHEWH